MNTGQFISGAAHFGLISWAVFGGAFQAEPLPFEVTEVTAISAEEYAALIAPEATPDAVASVDTPEPPQEGEAPDVTSEADVAPEVTQPETAETPTPDTPPEATETAPPAEAEVSDEAPVLLPPEQDLAVLAPEISRRPKPRPAPRVAPEPVAQPDPDLRIDDVDRLETDSDQVAETLEEIEEPSAREEATTEIVTEAEDDPASAAPQRSKRPQERPSRSAQTETNPTQQSNDGAVEDAIAAALNSSETQEEAVGQSITSAWAELSDQRRAALIQLISDEWSVDPGAPSARVTVVVKIELDEAGNLTKTPVMVSFQGEDTVSANVAFRNARIAIITAARLGAFKMLASENFQGGAIEMTFNPEKMRIK